MTLQQTIDAVREWGKAKGITGPQGKGTLLGQLAKTQEELTETRDAAIKWLLSEPVLRSPYSQEMKRQLMDGYGDQVVTIILGCEMAGLRFEDCLAAAYDEIKGRTGRMEGGVFIRD